MADQSEEKGKIDIEKILLPTKEVHTPASAQRINAAELLAQEQKAATEGLPKPPPTTPSAPTPKKEESAIKSIETYQGDVESLVEKKNISQVSIAVAEAQKRAQEAATPPPQRSAEEKSVLLRTGLIVGGVCLLALSAGVLVYIATRPTSVSVTPPNTQSPFITVDDTQEVTISAQPARDTLMEALNNARLAVKLSLGLIERIDVVSVGSDSSGGPVQTEMPVQILLNTLSPYVPQDLLRTLTGKYLVGVHSYDENQAFLILETDSYETAYAAMLAWEPTLQHDISPLISRTAPVHANGSATTTPAASVVSSGFVDRVVENHDSRVIQNDYGDILLLWTFLNKNTIVIATNEATLREIISRLSTANMQ